MCPLVENQDTQVTKNTAHKYHLRDELTYNVQLVFKVSEKDIKIFNCV